MHETRVHRLPPSLSWLINCKPWKKAATRTQDICDEILLKKIRAINLPTFSLSCPCNTFSTSIKRLAHSHLKIATSTAVDRAIQLKGPYKAVSLLNALGSFSVLSHVLTDSAHARILLSEESIVKS